MKEIAVSFPYESKTGERVIETFIGSRPFLTLKSHNAGPFFPV